MGATKATSTCWRVLYVVIGMVDVVGVVGVTGAVVARNDLSRA